MHSTVLQSGGTGAQFWRIALSADEFENFDELKKGPRFLRAGASPIPRINRPESSGKEFLSYLLHVIKLTACRTCCSPWPGRQIALSP
jgi:hypothetical protein